MGFLFPLIGSCGVGEREGQALFPSKFGGRAQFFFFFLLMGIFFFF